MKPNQDRYRLIPHHGVATPPNGLDVDVDVEAAGPDGWQKEVLALTFAQLTSPVVSLWSYVPGLMPGWPWYRPQYTQGQHTVGLTTPATGTTSGGARTPTGKSGCGSM